jgi:hypothetical protein
MFAQSAEESVGSWWRSLAAIAVALVLLAAGWVWLEDIAAPRFSTEAALRQFDTPHASESLRLVDRGRQLLNHAWWAIGGVGAAAIGFTLLRILRR